MMVPDQRHINQVCDALWQPTGAGASVMVGSGFSRNARGLHEHSRPLPMLDDIADHLYAKLYPERDISKIVDPQTKKLPPERILRLAQEYEGTFGESTLQDTLRNLVPDDDFRPGEAHRRLLRLPWADVFTTNWDRLLERTCEHVPDRSYTVVRNKNDIPSSARPRIVKLHGSLRNSRLILTDEDYRRYPSLSAPLVSTVQHAMMETAFLLVGFSGNDPNFLHWSGWVRDNLGDAAPPIYLAGYLELPEPTRRMLQERKVIPIDLARHPRAEEWPHDSDLRHAYATDWILSTLECGQPYDVSRWPSPRGEGFCSGRNPLLHPIVANESTEPKKEFSELPAQTSADDRLRVATDTLCVWAHNRECYPGWLVPPSSKGWKVRLSTERWTPFILKELPGLKATERLIAVREVIWRHELVFMRLPDDLVISGEQALNAIDCQERSVEGDPAENIDWASIRHSWQDVAMALVTEARYRLDAGGFADRIASLEPFVGDDPEIGHRVRHERCLWASWSLEYEELTTLLDEWRTAECDPAWMMRKSALVREVGGEDEAVLLIERALTKIRAMPHSTRDVTRPSREGWALWSMASWSKMANVRERWSQLASVNCDPSMELHYLRNALARNRRDEATPQFDLGMPPKKPPRRSERLLKEAVYRSMRLSEVAGLPLFIGKRWSTDSADISAHLIKLASELLATSEPAVAMRQMLRVARYDKEDAFSRVLARDRVAVLSVQSARELAAASRRLLAYAHPRIEAPAPERNMLGSEQTGVAMEALSRFALRLDGDDAEGLLSDALALYTDPRIASEILVHEALGNTLRRCWESLSDAQRTDRILDMLDAPIAGMDGLVTEGQWFPEPVDFLSSSDVPPARSNYNEERWRAVVEIVMRGLSAEGMARERAARRLFMLAMWDRLTESEARRGAIALWKNDSDSTSELPVNTSLHDFVFMVLPAPSVGIARERFRHKWLRGDGRKLRLTNMCGSGAVGLSVIHDDPQKVDDILWQVGASIPFLRRHGRALDLSDEESRYLAGVIGRWTETNVPIASSVPDIVALSQSVFRRSLGDACYGLSWIPTEMELSLSLAERLYEKVGELNDNDVPAHGMLPGIANTLPARRDDIGLLMSTALVSDDDKMARSAVHSLRRWIVWASNRSIAFAAPPEHLVREIGISIATRRQAVLAEALYAAKWILEQGDDHHKDLVQDLVAEGLGYLSEELRYDREDVLVVGLDVPLVRWRCIEVARVLAKERRDVNPAVRRWLKIGRDDPLPEVRRVAEVWYREEEE